ncbi:hypothetical protein EUX98_g9352 [Antrodiella citrinella]|uniref:Uncharacterized protein n=1 Tax=Antrodiella citrinella TaxID=2447956 RepID=A0A4S4LWQ7_9APHY|nr:hypothetical protein EUX98_g9352 [Antrodiella citrinella]
MTREGMQTRAKNAEAHPGNIVKTAAAPRRTSAQVKADKQAAAEVKEKADQAQQTKLREIARLEAASKGAHIEFSSTRR